MPLTDPLVVLLLLAGPAAGSFVAVLVDRLPRGEDVLVRPSACRSCGRRLRPAEMIPIVSFAMARGRCRTCGAPIPSWMLYSELAAAGLAVLAVLAGGPVTWIWATALCLWLLLALALCDLVWFRLPDALTAALFAVALGRAMLPPGPGLWVAISGAVLGCAALGLIRLGYARLRKRQGLGLGDVKMMAGLGALAGPWLLPHLLLVAALAGLALALIRQRLVHHPLTAKTRLPFGTALAFAAGVLWLATTPVF